MPLDRCCLSGKLPFETGGRIKPSLIYWEVSHIELNDYGVDDIDGTVNDTTRIYSMAGGIPTPELSEAQLKDLLLQANKVPVERDSVYQTISR